MDTIRTGFLFGGRGPEHGISLQSAAAVLRALPEQISPVPIGITREGAWARYTGPVHAIQDGSWQTDFSHLSSLTPSFADGSLGEKLDVVFPLLHGTHGEDGEIQGVLRALRIPFVGCGICAGAVGMNKARAAACLRDVVPLPRSLALQREEVLFPGAAVAHAESAIGYPMFLKPALGGSSFGAGIVRSREELHAGLQQALRYAEGAEILCQEFIQGREVEVALLEDGGALLASPPGEIRFDGGFYDFDTKYRTGRAVLQAPADLPADTAGILRLYALRVFRALGCRGLARADFFLTRDGRVLFNEINTLPGFTEHSMYPILMGLCGYSLPRLILTLVQNARGDDHAGGV